MSTIDDRIISLKFDNAQFEQNISATLASLDKLDSKISQVGAAKGFGALQGAANSVDLAPLSASVDNISSKFSALGAVGFSAIQKLTQGLMSSVANTAKNDILEPLITGGAARATSIEQAKFDFNGLGLKTQEVMQNATDAVTGTAYSLSDAAGAAAQFGAAGIPAGDQMTQSLRAIAGAAALTGSQYKDMAMIFTQSAATGKVNNQDLLQFSTRNLNATKAYADAIGKTQAQVHEMAAKGQIDYASFAKVMDDAYGKHATEANQTYTGALDNMHTALSRIGADFYTMEHMAKRNFFNAITPDIKQVQEAIQPLTNSLLHIMGIMNDGAIKKLTSFKFSDLTTGMTIPNLSDSMLNTYKAFAKILDIVKSAFHDIFPTNVTLTLLTLSTDLKLFTEKLLVGAQTAEKLKTVFEGFFSILSIGWAIFKGIITMVKEIASAIAPAGSGLLNFGVSISNILIRLKEFLVDGGKINSFFTKLGSIIAIPIKFIDEIVKKMLTFFGILAGAGADNVTKKFQSISDGANHVASAWDTIMNKLSGVFSFLDGVWNYISNWFSQLGQNIANALKQTNFNSVIDVLNTGLIASIAALLYKVLSGGLAGISFQGGIFSNIQGSIKQLSSSLKLMQTSLKAQALMKIAEAVGVLAVSMILLSFIDSKKLAAALVAISVGFSELILTMAAMDKVLGATGVYKLSVLSGVMIALASAMLILSLAIKVMASMSWNELVKGLIGIAGGVTIMVTAINLIDADSDALLRAGITMGIVAGSLYILSKAVESFGNMSWGQIGKGLVGVAGGLTVIIAAMWAIPPTGVLSGAGFIEIAIGLNILAKAVGTFGHMSWGTLLKGLTGVALALLAIEEIMNFMPSDLPATAAGVLILGIALEGIASVINKLGHMSWGALLKGLAGMALALLAIEEIMNFMPPDIVVTAAGLLIVAYSLTVLAKVLQTLGAMSIGQLATSIGAIAIVLGVLGGAAFILEPVIPAMLALGIALAVIGGAFALFGAGAFLAVTALSLFASVGVKAITALVQAIPALAAAAALFIVNFAEHILDGMAVFIKVITVVIAQILVTIIKLAPLLGAAFVVLMTTMLNAVHKLAPKIINTGLFILVSLLSGISKNIGQIVTLGSNIIINFLNALTLKMPQIVTAGVNVIVAFINGVANNIGRIITAGANLIIAFINGIASNALRIIDAAFQAIITFINGLTAAVNQYAPQIRSATLSLGEAIINGVTGGLANKIGDIMSWCTGLAGQVIGWVGDAGSWLLSAGGDVIHGLWKGILDAKDWFVSKLGWFAGLLPGFVKDILGIHSPSTVFAEIGNNIMLGWAGGIEGGQPHVQKTLTNVANNMTKTFNSALSDSLSNMSEFNPVITPVLDLTRVQSQSSKIAGYLNVSSITPGASMQQANVISNTSGGSNNTSTPSAVNNQPGDITFIQNNNSPKALSAADIYRSTKSQIALAKEELSIP